MTKTLGLHIGDPKTGSTSIQRTLFERRWDCPTVSLDYPPVLSAISLANVLKDESSKRRARRNYKEISAWIDQSNAQVVVLSAEQFSSVPPLVLKKTLGKYLPDYAEDARVIAYARPHASRILSSYAQRIKTGSIKKSLDEFFADPSRLTIVNLAKRFSAWHEAFGDRFVLRPMVRSELRGGDVVEDFLGLVLNDAPFTLHGDTEANVSISGEALAGLRMFQLALKSNGVGDAARHAIGNRINNLISVTPAQGGTKLKLHKSLYDEVLAYCYEDAQNLDREFFESPVMETALIEAGKDTVSTAFDIEASVHYPPEALAALEQHAAAIAAVFEAHPDVWLKAHKRDKGRAPDIASDEELSPDAPAAISKINDHLVQTAAVLTSIPARPV